MVYEGTRHAVDIRKSYMLVPFLLLQNMTTDEVVLGRLTAAVVAAHRLLAGHTAAAAERQYIVEAQQLSGYGLEYYPAKVNHDGRTGVDWL